MHTTGQRFSKGNRSLNVFSTIHRESKHNIKLKFPRTGSFASPSFQPNRSDMDESEVRPLACAASAAWLRLAAPGRQVEGGRIDHAHHDTKARRALAETLEFESAIKRATEMTDAEETLMIVTADHSHVMTIQGYPVRGRNILGKDTAATLTTKLSDFLPCSTL